MSSANAGFRRTVCWFSLWVGLFTARSGMADETGAGAPWPAVAALLPPAKVEALASDHWSFRPVVRPKVPPNGAGHPVDAFLRAKLAQRKLKPSAEADRRTLIRRLTFDLIGLPPTPEEVAAFESDRSVDAYAKLVDRLLANPHYG